MFYLVRQRDRARARGQAVVELALILPVLLVSTLAILDAGRVMAAQVTLTNAAREGALYASKNPTATNEAVASRVAEDGADLDPSELTVDAPVRTTLYVTVTARYSVDLLTPMLGALWGNPVNLTASVSAPVLN